MGSTAALLLLLLLPAAASSSPPPAFSGAFFSGEGDTGFLELLDTARTQWSTEGLELQSVNQLYRGDWDGLMEGPTWGACEPHLAVCPPPSRACAPQAGRLAPRPCTTAPTPLLALPDARP